jgi:chemotaxis protein histidine kinase CheA
MGMNKSVCCDTGRHLDKEQIPDGTHKPTLAPTLKKEQAPDIEKSINSGMVEKSHGAVQKEAATGADIAKAREEKKKKELLKAVEKDQKAKKGKKGEKSASDEAEEKIEQIAEKKEEEAEELVEKAQDDLDSAKKKLEEAKKEEEKAEKEEKDATTSSVIDGIELMASMDEIELDAGEAAELSKLF